MNFGVCIYIVDAVAVAFFVDIVQLNGVAEARLAPTMCMWLWLLTFPMVIVPIGGSTVAIASILHEIVGQDETSSLFFW